MKLIEVKIKPTRIFFSVLMLSSIYNLQAQDYRAINGTTYTGSLAVANNPASIVHIPNVWDITPIALQFKHTTNAVIINNASFLPPWKNATANSHNGTFKPNLLANQDLRLLNVRIRLNSNSAIAFGLSGRAYLSAKTSTLNWQDTVGYVREFMGINFINSPASGEARGSGWAELFGTYARTIIMYNNAVLNAGITVKLNTGIAGGYINAKDVEEVAGPVNNLPSYYLSNGILDYGYSSNIDVLDTATSFSNGKKDFFRNTFSTVGISVGAEYITPRSGYNNYGYDYDLKIGMSLLDIGKNVYHYSDYSRSAILNKNNISDTLIQTTFENIDGPAAFADSLQSIAGTISMLTGKFNIYQPIRFVINVDKHIAKNFFINADLTLPLVSVFGKNKLYDRDMNFISLTPRVETKRFGVYLPASINTRLHVWVGGAIKAGPVLFGIHNWANIFAKNKLQEGGAYLALSFRFNSKNEINSDTDNLNGQRFSGKQMKQLRCPPLVQ